MSGFELVAFIIGNFFVTGIVLGVLIVTGLPMRRGRRSMNGDDWRELPPPVDDDDWPPRWPGT